MIKIKWRINGDEKYSLLKKTRLLASKINKIIVSKMIANLL